MSLALCGIILLSSVSVYAKSNSKSTKNSALGATLKSNCWIQSLSDLSGGGEYQVSAQYNSTKSEYSFPDWIRTSWDFYSVGVNVGISVSGGSGLS